MFTSDFVAANYYRTDSRGSVVQEVPLSDDSVSQTSAQEGGIGLVYLASSFLGIAFIIVIIKQLQARKLIGGQLSINKPFQKIPCTNCQYFNGNIYLKCAVQPSKVMSDQAKDCSDFEPKEPK